MSFISLSFLAFTVVAIVFAHVSSGRSWRPWGMLALSLLFVATAMMGWIQALFLGGFCSAIFAGLLAVEKSRRWLPVVLAVEIALFAWLKQYAIVSDVAPLPTAAGLAGLSYILFRGIHLTVDIADGALRRPGALATFNYLLFFPTFISGPIQRFEEIGAQLMSRGNAPDEAETFSALVRAIFGCVKVTLVSSTLLIFHEIALAKTLQASGLLAAEYFFVAATLYALYLYVNFSGYMDIVISVAMLMGFRLSENFNHPFAARNILEFWTRWHITLSDWFRFYLFNPLLKALTRRWPAPAWTPYFGVIAFFATFLIMGIWHGSTAIFVVYGLVLGLGISGNRLYQVLMIRWLGRKRYAELAAGRLYRAIARGAVFAYFALALTCLFLNAEKAKVVLQHVGIWLVPGWIVLVCGAAAGLPLWDLVETTAAAIRRRVVSASSLMQSAALAVALIVFIGIQVWDTNATPPLAYRGY